MNFRPKPNESDPLLLDLLAGDGLHFLWVRVTSDIVLYVFPDVDSTLILDRKDPRAPHRACTSIDVFTRALPLWATGAATGTPALALGAWWDAGECRALATAVGLLAAATAADYSD